MTITLESSQLLSNNEYRIIIEINETSTVNRDY